MTPVPHRLRRFVLAVVATAALALAVVAVPLFVLKPGPHEEQVHPTSVTASVEEFSTVPRLGTEERHVLADGIRSFLAGLYNRAFTDVAAATPAPQGTPDPVAGIGAMFSPSALSALRANAGVFVPPERVRVYNGRVAFSGVATVDRAHRTQAFLNITFFGDGRIGATPVELVQKGTMLLVHDPDGWHVTGFDLKITAESVAPSPSTHAMGRR